jgi:hypothetical protein
MTMTDMGAERTTMVLTNEVTASSFENNEVPSDLLDVRKRFVLSKDWLEYGTDRPDDRDIYDSNPKTIHVASRNAENLPIAALRITPVEILTESLSYEMLRPEMQAEVTESDLLPDGDFAMFDMTRLVVDLDMSPRVYVPEIASIIGEAEKQSVLHSDGKPVMWIFAVDGVFAKFLERTGMDVHIVANDGSGAKTMFGYAFPTDVKKQHMEPDDLNHKGTFGKVAVRASGGSG